MDTNIPVFQVRLYPLELKLGYQVGTPVAGLELLFRIAHLGVMDRPYARAKAMPFGRSL